MSLRKNLSNLIKKILLLKINSRKVTKKLDEKKNEKDFTNSPAKKKEQLDFIKKKSEINKTLATRDGVWKIDPNLKRLNQINLNHPK